MPINKLSEWISDSILNGQQKVILDKEPYFHGILDNFFRSEKLQLLQQELEKVQPQSYSLHKGLSYRYCVCPHKEFFHLIKSQAFKEFIMINFGVSVKICQKFPYPQFYVFDQKKNGIGIHTDVDPAFPRNFGMLVYIHKTWYPQNDGQLQLHGKLFEKPIEKVINPLPNRLFFFEVSPNSFHSVKECKGDWIRKTIVVDWDYD